MHNNKTRGFTLVELAIVLVIIGLIVGGVLVGQDLIKTAELRSILSDIERYQAASSTFRTKYNALPGDMRNASAVWGLADADPDIEVCVAAVDGIETCNGNGNGMLDQGLAEPLLFWHQLGNAQLVNFSPSALADPTAALAPNNTFGFVYMFVYAGAATALDGMFAGNYGNTLLSRSFTEAGGGALSPLDLRWLDEKKDDALPGTGVFRTVPNDNDDNTNCSTTNDPATAVYNTSYTTPDCIFFLLKAI